MGVLAFGLSSPRSLAIACGVLVCAWGPVQIAVYLKVRYVLNLLSSHIVNDLFVVAFILR